MATLRQGMFLYGCRRLVWQSWLVGHGRTSAHNHWKNYSTGYGDTVKLFLRQGYPVLAIPLPSRAEICEFTLRPYIQNVQTLMSDIKAEDRGIDRIAIYSEEGNKVAQSTGMDMLLKGNFDVEINNTRHRVIVPEEFYKVSLEGEESLSDVKNMIHKLYTSLNVDRHQLGLERELRGQLESLKLELAPLEDQCKNLIARSNSRTNVTVWSLLALMCVQAGFLGRLTFVDYSWDIMEPITYFVTYGTSIAAFSYFVITKQDYIYPDASDRQFLKFLYTASKRHKFDVSKYNHLKDTIRKVEEELKRLHDPLQLNLPTPDPVKILKQ